MIEASITQRTRQAEDYSKKINTCYSSLAGSVTRMRHVATCSTSRIVLRRPL